MKCRHSPRAAGPRTAIAVAALLLSAAVLAAAGPAAAQDDEVPARPRMDSRADTNDWGAYYLLGAKKLPRFPREANAAFYWARRLNPMDARPYYGAWIATWLTKGPMLEQYLQGAEFVMEMPETQHIDSLFGVALERDPFVFQSFERYLYGTTEWSLDDPFTGGWLSYTEGRFDEAVKKFGTALKEEPKRLFLVHINRADAFYMLHQYDSAAAELDVVLSAMRQSDQKHLTYMYNSKEIFEYMTAKAYVKAGRYEKAKEAYGRALAENLSFYVAHEGLAQLAFFDGDTATAVNEYDLAVQLEPADAALRFDYGTTLLQAKRYDAAAEQLRQALALDPDFSLPYFNLGLALEFAGKNAAAREAYNGFLAHAPRAAAPQIAAIKQRLAALGTSEGGGQ